VCVTLNAMSNRTEQSVVDARRDTVTVHGRARSFITVRGRTPAARPALLLMLHGTMQTANNIRPFAGYSFDALAAAGEVVVIYPDAVRREWNGARKAVMMFKANKAIDDVGFIRALIDYAVGAEDVDPSRVFVAGFSLGGQMTLRLIHEIPDLLAGAAVLSANMPTPDYLTLGTDARMALPVLTVHGTADPLAPYQGGVVTFHGLSAKGLHLSAEQTARYFAERNGITTEPALIELPHRRDVGRPTSVTQRDYTAPGAKPVRFYTVHGGGHVLNNPTHVSWQWFWGSSTRDLCLADVVAEFFDLPTTSNPSRGVL
jgi:polyhydroxybutyrate depolymerase